MGKDRLIKWRRWPVVRHVRGAFVGAVLAQIMHPRYDAAEIMPISFISLEMLWSLKRSAFFKVMSEREQDMLNDVDMHLWRVAPDEWQRMKDAGAHVAPRVQKTKAWGVVSPMGGDVMSAFVRGSESAAIKAAEDESRQQWHVLRDKGYGVVPVEVVEVDG